MNKSISKAQVLKKTEELFREVQAQRMQDAGDGKERVQEINAYKYFILAVWELVKEKDVRTFMSFEDKSLDLKNKFFPDWINAMLTWLSTLPFVNGWRRLQLNNQDKFSGYTTQDYSQYQKAYLKQVRVFFMILLRRAKRLQNIAKGVSQQDRQWGGEQDMAQPDIFKQLELNHFNNSKTATKPLRWNVKYFMDCVRLITKYWGNLGVQALQTTDNLQTIMTIIANTQKEENEIRKKQKQQSKKKKREKEKAQQQLSTKKNVLPPSKKKITKQGESLIKQVVMQQAQFDAERQAFMQTQQPRKKFTLKWKLPEKIEQKPKSQVQIPKARYWGISQNKQPQNEINQQKLQRAVQRGRTQRQRIRRQRVNRLLAQQRATQQFIEGKSLKYYQTSKTIFDNQLPSMRPNDILSDNPLAEVQLPIQQMIRMKQKRQFVQADTAISSRGKYLHKRNYKGQEQYIANPIQYLKQSLNDRVKDQDLIYYLTVKNYQKIQQSGVIGQNLFKQPHNLYKYHFKLQEQIKDFHLALIEFVGQDFFQFFKVRLRDYPKIGNFYLISFCIWCMYQVFSHYRRFEEVFKKVQDNKWWKEKDSQGVLTRWFWIFADSFFWWAPQVRELKKDEFIEFCQQWKKELEFGWNSIIKNPRVLQTGYQNIFPRFEHFLGLPQIKPDFQFGSDKQRFVVVPVKQERAQAFIQRVPNGMFLDWVSAIYYSQLVWLTNSIVGFLMSSWGKQQFYDFGWQQSDLRINSSVFAKNFMSTTFRAQMMTTSFFLPKAWNHQFSFTSFFNILGIYFSQDVTTQIMKFRVRNCIMDYVDFAVSQQICQWPNIFLTWVKTKAQNDKIQIYQQMFQDKTKNAYDDDSKFQLGAPIAGIGTVGGSYTQNVFNKVNFISGFQNIWFCLGVPNNYTIQHSFLKDVFTIVQIDSRGFKIPQPQGKLWKQQWRHYGTDSHVHVHPRFKQWIEEDASRKQLKCWDKVLQFLPTIGYSSFPQQNSSFDSILQIHSWCHVRSISCYFQNYKSYNIKNPDWGWVIYLSPCHIDVVTLNIFKDKMFVMPNLAINYQLVRGQMSLQSQPLWSREYRPTTWAPFQRLPIQTDYKISQIREFRERSICIDFQCLATVEQAQIPYLVCAIGFPFQFDQFLQIRFLDVKTQTHLIGTSTPHQGEKIEHHFNGVYKGQCIDNFIEWLARNSNSWTKDKPLYIYSFNGFRYQIVFLYNKLVQRFGRVDSLGAPRQARGFSLFNSSIQFIDACKLVPGIGLGDACDNYKTLVRKKKGMQIQKYDNWQKVDQNLKTIIDYCLQDCVACFLLIEKIYVEVKRLYKTPKTVAQIKKKTTAPSLAWDYWIQQFYQKKLVNKWDLNGIQYKGQVKNQNQEPPFLYKLQRQNYFGGIVQVYQYIVQQNIYPLDINSMYPYQMTQDMPWQYLGPIIDNLQNSLQEPSSDLYFYQLGFFEFPRQWQFNFIPVKGKTRNEYFGSYRQREQNICVWGHTLKFLRRIGGKYFIKYGWRYGTGNQYSLRQFSNFIYNKRKQAKKDGNQALSTVLKLLMNSLTGRLSMKQRSSGYVTAFWANHKDLDFEVEEEIPLADSQYVTYIGKQILPQPGRLVRITSYITSASRVTLASKAQKAGVGNFFYCDTDSLYVNKKGWQNLGKPQRSVSQLGQLKLEMGKNQQFIRGYFFSRKFYILQDAEGKYLKKVKGIPTKFLQDQKVKQLIEGLKRVERTKLKESAFQGQYPILNQWGRPITIPIQVWRRDYLKGHVIIQKMKKKVNLQNDRGYRESRTVGWRFARSISIPKYEGQQD